MSRGIDTQHLFMNAFVEQLLKPEKRFNMVSIIETVLVHMTTDFNDAVDYLIYLDELSVEKVHMTTLPGKGSTTDGSYIYDVDATKALFEGILNKINTAAEAVDANPETGEDLSQTEGEGESQVTQPTVEVTPLPVLDAKEYTISVLNGTYTAGLAKTFKTMLEEDGFTVTEPGNYDNKPIERTIITVPIQELGDELSHYFNNPKIVIDETLKDKPVPVIIAIGSNDSN